MDCADYISYVLSARRRCDVLQKLSNNDYTARELADETLISYQYTVIKLQELCDHGLVTHNNVKRGKIYSITPLGRSVINRIVHKNHTGYKRGV